MSEHYPRLRLLSSHGDPMVREGIAICFYMRRSSREVARAVEQSLDTYVRAVGAQRLAWYSGEDDWLLLDDTSWTSLRTQLVTGSWPRVELTDDPAGVHELLFEYYGKWFEDPRNLNEPGMVSAIGFWLPTEYLEAHGPEAVRELALQLANSLPFSSGHAGLCFRAVHGYREAEQELSRLCLRYPGIDIILLSELSWRLGTQVKAPSWLTFLGQPVLGQLGGIEALRSRLSSPGTTVQPLEGERAVISLGPWPEAGDTQAGHHLPEYRELARVLEPHLYHSPKPGSPYFPEDIRRRWERRFLD